MQESSEEHLGRNDTVRLDLICIITARHSTCAKACTVIATHVLVLHICTNVTNLTIHSAIHMHTLSMHTIGELQIGEPCAPYAITQVRHGTEQVRETITGRKIPLLDIRRQALKDHFPFVRLSHKDSILAAERGKLEELVGSVENHMSDCELRKYVERHLALRHFALWHDHATVCGCGYTLMTLKEVYNR